MTNKISDSIANEVAGYQNYKVLTVTLQDKVATVSINNPPLNVMDGSLMTELYNFVGKVGADRSIKVIVFESANPEFFVAHGDMNFVTNPESFLALAALAGDTVLNPMQQLHENIRTLPQVTIAKLRGFARGGGSEFALSMDMRFASSGKTWLAQPEVLMGIIPGGGGTQYITKLSGRSRALQVILGAELLDSETLEKHGLVNKQVEDSDLDQYVATFSKRVASLPEGVIEGAKYAVDSALNGSNGMLSENEMLGNLFSKPEAVNRMVAALEAGAQTVEGERKLEAILNHI